MATYELDTIAMGRTASQPAHFTFLPSSVGSSGLGPLYRSALEGVLVLATLGLGIWQSYNNWDADRSAALLYAGLTVLGLLLQASILPLASTVMTWFVLRGRADLGPSSLAPQRLLSYLRQMVHATERRVMRYHVPMKSCAGSTAAGFPAAILLTAHKTVMYRASADQWVRWVLGLSLIHI